MIDWELRRKEKKTQENMESQKNKNVNLKGKKYQRKGQKAVIIEEKWRLINLLNTACKAASLIKRFIERFTIFSAWGTKKSMYKTNFRKWNERDRILSGETKNSFIEFKVL